MAISLLNDKIKQSASVSGTGSYTVTDRYPGFYEFSRIGNGNSCVYKATYGTDWEVGLGTYTASTGVIARTLVYNSSNDGGAVNWSGTTVTIEVIDAGEAVENFQRQPVKYAIHDSTAVETITLLSTSPQLQIIDQVNAGTYTITCILPNCTTGSGGAFNDLPADTGMVYSIDWNAGSTGTILSCKKDTSTIAITGSDDVCILCAPAVTRRVVG